MPKAAITRVSSMSITPTSNPATNQANNGFYAPQLTQTQINAISTPQNGAIVYNTTTNTGAANGVFNVYEQSGWSSLATSTDVAGYTTIAFGAGAPTVQAPFSTLPHPVGALYFATTAPKLWVCSVAGTPGTWIGVTVV